MTDQLTLTQLSRIIAEQLSVPQLRGVWVKAETSDVAVRGGHCYLELLEKSDDGTTVAKARATIWRSTWIEVDHKFRAATESELRSGMKVLVKVNVDYHANYGFKLVISDIDPSYTIGDAIRRRREIIDRLTREGVINDNRNLAIPAPVQNIAVISAPGAAGYGDLINQLFNNQRRLRFNVKLFEAVMQGAQVPVTVKGALDRIFIDAEKWDLVVIIRGGGATSDLEAFDNYDLAYHISQFPIPVIVGIGHERDVTVLDWVARRVKTPTAAAEWLISTGIACIERLQSLATTLQMTVTEMVAGCNEQLSRFETLLSVAPHSAIERADSRLRRDGMIVADLTARVINPRINRLEALENKLSTLAPVATQRRRARLDALEQMLSMLSPEATPKRGYSITRCNGVAVTNPATLAPGDVIETTLAGGIVTSTVK